VGPRNSFTDRFVIRPRLNKLRKGLGERYLERVRVYAETTTEIAYRQANPHEPPFVYAIAMPRESVEVSRREQDPQKLQQGAIKAMEVTITTFLGKIGVVTGSLAAYDEFGHEVPPINQ
jgi:hypothetical protein